MDWNLKQRAFRVISRICMRAYGRLPIFGPLRGSAAVIQRDGRFLALERSDGLGLAFPGGLAYPWESDEQALSRELQEETGMRLTSWALLLRYTASVPYPSRVSIYRAEAEGQLRPSWEGIPCWVGLPELQQRLMPNQRPVLEGGLLEKN